MNPEDAARHPSVGYTRGLVIQSMGSLIMQHVEEDRLAYRQHLKTLEQNLLKQGLTEEEYQAESRQQRERMDTANKELNDLAQQGVGKALETRRLQRLKDTFEADIASYSAAAAQMEAKVLQLQAAYGTQPDLLS